MRGISTEGRLAALRGMVSSELNIFIDVDYTLIAANGSLRPNTRELFLRLREAGHQPWVWSGMGIRKEDMIRHGMDGCVAGYIVKPLDDYLKTLRRLEPEAWPDLIVDDHSEIVEAFGGITVRPYFFTDDEDRELRRAEDALLQYAETGECADPAFRAPPDRVSRLPA